MSFKGLAVSAVATAALFVGMSAHEAQAVEVTILSVTGTWSNVTGTATDLNGTNTNQIFFGENIGNGQSSYKFVGAAPPAQGPFPVGSGLFTLGTFTHINRPIGGGSSITGATLNLSIEFDTDVTSPATLSSSFTFLHNETPNDMEAGNCCDDIVTAFTNVGGSTTLNIGGIDHIFSFTGFQVGGFNFAQLVVAGIGKHPRRHSEGRSLTFGTFLVPLSALACRA